MKHEHPRIIIFTDGSFMSNYNMGGWCAYLLYNLEHEMITSGWEYDTTNNRMEIVAVLRALQILTVPCTVEIYSDSQYVVNAISQHWLSRWKKNGWRTGSREPVKNKDLWEQLIIQLARHDVKAYWVKGHNDHPGNELCDRVAKSQVFQGMRKMSIKISNSKRMPKHPTATRHFRRKFTRKP